jgi:hypothetical protein
MARTSSKVTAPSNPSRRHSSLTAAARLWATMEPSAWYEAPHVDQPYDDLSASTNAARGLDRSAEMIRFIRQEAQQEAVTFEWSLSDRRDFRLRPSVDYACCLFNAIDGCTTRTAMTSHRSSLLHRSEILRTRLIRRPAPWRSSLSHRLGAAHVRLPGRTGGGDS